MLYEGEPDSFCCHNGKVQLPKLDPLPQFWDRLYTSQDSDAVEFRKHINSYNNALTLTSAGMDRNMPPGYGPPVFKIQGVPHHRVGHLEPPKVKGRQLEHSYAQLYLIDVDEAQQLREGKSKYFESVRSKKLLRACSDWLRENNEAVQKFLMCQERQLDSPDQDYCVVFEEQGPANQSRRRWNLPTHGGMCGVVKGLNELNNQTKYRDIVVHYRRRKYGKKNLFHINETHPAYDPLHYVLLFPRGKTTGWELYLKKSNGSRLTSNNFYRYRFVERKDAPNYLCRAALLGQKYAIDMFSKILMQNLRYYRKNQSKIRAAAYQELKDAAESGDIDNAAVGKRIICPSTVKGSDRHMRKTYYNFMAVVRKFGPPTFFLTVTCNSKWREISEALFAGQKPHDRPEIASRVFKQKLNQIMDDLYKYGVLGRAVAKLYVVEFQKRGLPHAHILIFLHSEDQPRAPEDVDRVVCSEVPDINTNPQFSPSIPLRS